MQTKTPSLFIIKNNKRKLLTLEVWFLTFKLNKLRITREKKEREAQTKKSRERVNEKKREMHGEMREEKFQESKSERNVGNIWPIYSEEKIFIRRKNYVKKYFSFRRVKRYVK